MSNLKIKLREYKQPILVIITLIQIMIMLYYLKIENKVQNIEEINYTILGLLSPGITINEVRNEVIVNKIKPELPENIQDVLICENRNCITSQEKYIPHKFTLVDRNKGSYKCEYCEQIINPSEV